VVTIKWDTCRKDVVDLLADESSSVALFLLSVAIENDVDGMFDRGLVLQSV
jgi:hypothetical protein